MPCIKGFNYNEIPGWSVLKKWEIYEIPIGSTEVIDTGYSKCGVYLLNGRLEVDDGYGAPFMLATLGPNAEFRKVFKSGKIKVASPRDGNWWDHNTIAVFSGDWSDDDWIKVGGFDCGESKHPFNDGDPVEYAFHTNFPNHYHEYDEYFLILRGSAVFMDDGNMFEVSPGDLIATKRGNHHHVVSCEGTLTAAEFGARLGGKKREYFLYEHTHGKPITED